MNFLPPDPDAVHPVLIRLADQTGGVIADGLSTADTAAKTGDTITFFPGDLEAKWESADIATILPMVLTDVAAALPGPVSLVIVPHQVEDDALRAVFGVLGHPTLVLQRDGRFLTAIPGMRPWAEYATLITEAFAAGR